jgi:hypothetical protein
VHYSSAKIIARTARRNKLYYMFDKEDATAPLKICSYREINPEPAPRPPQDEVKVNEEEREEEHSKGGESFTDFSLLQWSKIEIHSTIGWKYPSQADPMP